jgi:anti-sigma factor RsiW
MRPSRCDRTRSLLSQRLDGAISEIEWLAIERHLAACGDCRAFEAQSRWLVDELRAAPLERPSRPVTVSPLRTGWVSNRLGANISSVAALLVVAVGGWAVGLSVPSGGPSDPAATTALEPAAGDALRQLRFDALRAGDLPMLPETPPPAHVKPPRMDE